MTDEVITVAGGFHVGDTVRYNDRAPSGVQGWERVIDRAGPHAAAVWFTNNNWAEVDGLDLVSCPHVQQFQPGDIIEYHTRGDNTHWYGPFRVVQHIARPNELTSGRDDVVWFDENGRHVWVDAARVRLAQNPPPAPTTPTGYTPWGPDHPDWELFWKKADALASRLGYCDEYQRMALELGRTAEVTYAVTVLVTVASTVREHVSPIEMDRAFAAVNGATIRDGVRISDVSVYESNLNHPED